MKVLTLALLSAALLSPVDLPRQPGLTRQAGPPLEGQWDAGTLSYLMDGKVHTQEGDDDFRITRGTLVFAPPHGDASTATYRLGAGGNPDTIDITFTAGKHVAGQTWRGIYRIRGDTLELFVSRRDGVARPERFGSWPVAGDDIGAVLLFVLKRR